MRAKLRTVAVCASALIVVGGAAAAYVTAASVSGGGTATTTTNDYRVSLSAHESNIPVMMTSPYTIEVLGRNESTVPVRVPAGSLAAPTLAVNERPRAGTCPRGSFTVGAPTDYTEVSIAPGTTEVVAWLPVSFVALPDQPQNGCIGATLAFSWPTQALPAG